MHSNLPADETRLETAAQTGGAAAVVDLLGKASPSRFTAVFELVGTDLLNTIWFDKRGEARPSFAISIPFRDSFCRIALQEGEFRSFDTATDPRVQYSPYKGVIVSYYAVPLVDFRGALRGTLSHFDFEKVMVDDRTFELMRRAATLLPRLLYGEHRRVMDKVLRGEAPD